jgi:hypothetical protein
LSYFGLARPVPSRRLPASRRAQLDLRTALTAGDEATVSYERRERLSWRSPELHLLRRYAWPKGRLPIDTNKNLRLKKCRRFKLHQLGRGDSDWLHDIVVCN